MVRCAWGRCGAEFKASSRGGQCIPHFRFPKLDAKRRDYTDAAGKFVDPHLYPQWRKEWLHRCGLTDDEKCDTTRKILNDFRVCVSHFDPTWLRQHAGVQRLIYPGTPDQFDEARHFLETVRARLDQSISEALDGETDVSLTVDDAKAILAQLDVQATPDAAENKRLSQSVLDLTKRATNLETDLKRTQQMYAALDEATSGESVYFRMDRLRKMRDENVYLIYSAKM